MSAYLWRLRGAVDGAAMAHLQRALNDLPEALCRSLMLRGITSFEAARQFFRATAADLHDPFLMKGMDVAARRLVRAIQRRERVFVYGDYDVDGTTSAALLTHFLRSHGARTTCFIPNRFLHGYGLHTDGIDAAAAAGAQLVVALDCGITAVREARYARQLGLDLIICDHHLAGAVLPEALAILNPNQPTCTYPFKDLCGCGVTFKLVQATLSRLGGSPEEASVYLDYVALATACDVVPVIGENRVLLKAGLQQMREAVRPGLGALATVAGIDLAHVSTRNLSFGLGPRLNAAGRVGSAMRAVDLLLAENHDRAHDLAQNLHQANELRRALNRDIEQHALEKARIHLSGAWRHALVLHDPSWHQGVLGIVASRLVESFSRPVVVLCTTDGLAKGSARSIDGFDVHESLRACAELLTRYGGHAHAAGLALPVDNIDAFRQRFNELAMRSITPDMMVPTLRVDALLHLGLLTPPFWAVLRQFAPHGPGNPQPVFIAKDLSVVGKPRLVGKNQDHLRFVVRSPQADAPPRPIIGFGLGERLATVTSAAHTGQQLDVAFCIEEDHWDGLSSLRLRALDLRPAASQDLFATSDHDATSPGTHGTHTDHI